MSLKNFFGRLDEWADWDKFEKAEARKRTTEKQDRHWANVERALLQQQAGLRAMTLEEITAHQMQQYQAALEQTVNPWPFGLQQQSALGSPFYGLRLGFGLGLGSNPFGGNPYGLI